MISSTETDTSKREWVRGKAKESKECQQELKKIKANTSNILNEFKDNTDKQQMNEINKSIKGMNKAFSRQPTLKISNGDVRNEKLSKSKKINNNPWKSSQQNGSYGAWTTSLKNKVDGFQGLGNDQPMSKTQEIHMTQQKIKFKQL